MGNYIEPTLNEEQLAAYMDGMLSEEENGMVENIINEDPYLEEIVETMDNVDSAIIYAQDEEVPIECLADDFQLPTINGEYTLTDNIDNDDYNDYQQDDYTLIDDMQDTETENTDYDEFDF